MTPSWAKKIHRSFSPAATFTQQELLLGMLCHCLCAFDNILSLQFYELCVCGKAEKPNLYNKFPHKFQVIFYTILYCLGNSMKKCNVVVSTSNITSYWAFSLYIYTSCRIYFIQPPIRLHTNLRL